MKNCTGCKYANWDRTAKGRLHPSGTGKCDYPWAMPPLPNSMNWYGYGREPKPSYPGIERHRDYKTDCPYYTKEEKTK